MTKRSVIREVATQRAAAQLDQAQSLGNEPARDDKAVVLPIGLIQVGENVRSELHGIDELAESIKTNTLLNPLTVRRCNTGAFILIAGARRLAALKKLGAQEVPVRVQDADDQQVHVLRLIENLQRDDLSGWDTISAVNALLPLFENSQARVAEAIGKDKSYVSRCVAVASAELEVSRVKLLPLRQLFQLVCEPKASSRSSEKKPDRYNDVKYREGSRHAFSLKVSFHPKKTSPEVRQRLVERLQYLLTKLKDASEPDSTKQDGQPT